MVSHHDKWTDSMYMLREVPRTVAGEGGDIKTEWQVSALCRAPGGPYGASRVFSTRWSLLVQSSETSAPDSLSSFGGSLPYQPHAMTAHPMVSCHNTQQSRNRVETKL